MKTTHEDGKQGRRVKMTHEDDMHKITNDSDT